MRRTTAAAAAGAIGLATLGGIGIGGTLMSTAVAETAVAAPQDADTPDRQVERTARITAALAALVEDGTITQAQADAVAETLASTEVHGGPGGHGGHGGPGFGILQEGLETAATTLGLTEDELRTQLEGGATLGEVADGAGVDHQVLVGALVQFAQQQLAERVSAGALTQERADAIGADLQVRITKSLDRSLPGGHGGHGRGGHGGGGLHRTDDGDG